MNATARAVFAASLVAGMAATGRSADPAYWQDVRPLLRKHCLGCHSARHLKNLDLSGGLALDTYEAVLKGSSKPVVRPGNSADSRLIQLITSDDTEARMPQNGKPLSADAVELLRRWIDLGAPEGQRPSAVDAANRRTPARKIDVELATPLVPPAQTFPGLTPVPLSLSLRIGPLAPATTVAFSPDGTLLACGSQGLVTLWDLRLGQVVRALGDWQGMVCAVRFSPDGALLAVAGGMPAARGELRLYRVSNGSRVANLAGHQDVVTAVAFHPDGSRLASAAFDKTIRLWDLQSVHCERILTGHADVVNAVAFGPQGRWLASAGKDRTARLTETSSGKSLFSLGALNELQAVAASPDGQWVVAAGADATLTWWKAQTGERGWVRGAHHGAVGDLCFSQDGRLLVSAGSDKTVRFWDPGTGNEKQAVVLPSPVYAVALSPNGKLAAAACFDGRVRIYEVQNARPVLTLLAVPVDGGEAHWLTQTPQGHLIGSPKLLIQGKWMMGGKSVPADPVWRAVFSPEAVAHAAKGEPQAAPSFGR
jgi:WD40 repeat protein